MLFVVSLISTTIIILVIHEYDLRAASKWNEFIYHSKLLAHKGTKGAFINLLFLKIYRIVLSKLNQDGLFHFD